MRIIAIIMLSALLLTGCFNQSLPAPGPDFPSNPAPEFQLEDLSGTQWKMEDLRGEMVILYFWTASCPTCIKKLPDLIELNEQLPGDVRLLLLNASDSKARVQELIGDSGLVGLLNAINVFRAYGVQYVPTMIFVDKDGMIRQTHIGPASNADILSTLDLIR